MLNVVIVDDEQILRDGIKTIIEWENYGCHIVGEADSGTSGIQVIKKIKPDIALVDVKMPEMSGIEMITALKEEDIRTKFIILSGHSDFAYTKKAILLDVFAYLLKPLDEDELIQLLGSIRKKIEEENILGRYFEKGKKYVLDDLVKMMIENTYQNMDMAYDSAEIEALIGPSDYCVAIINVLSGGNELNERVVKYLRNEKIFAYENQHVVAVLSVGANQTMGKQMLEKLLTQLECFEGIRTFAVVGCCVKKRNKLHVSYKEAKELMQNKFLISHLRIVSTNDFSTKKQNASKQVGKIETILEKLTLAPQTMDKDYISVGIQSLNQVFCEGLYSECEIKSYCINLLIDLLNKISVQTNCTEGINREDILQKIYLMDNLHQLIEYVELQLNQLTDVLGDVNADTTVKRVEHYVKKNYDARLTLNILGAIFGYSSVYLGKIFKQHTGLSFSHYLDRVRIEEAKKLLANEDMKVYQIAERIGFKSSDYFCLKFKKSEGVSPTEYKENMQKQAGNS